MSKLRILLIDDHAILRQGMRRLIEAESDMKVVGEAEDGSEISSVVAAHRPDVVVLDLSMPGVGGLEALRQLRSARTTCKVLVLTVHQDGTYFREAFEAGALGYMLKRATAEELIDAIRLVARGQVFIDTRIKGLAGLLGAPARPPVEAPELTAREFETLRRIADGYSNKEIAAALDLSVKTVETYKARAMRKMGLHSRVDIIRLARERRWPPAGNRPVSG